MKEQVEREEHKVSPWMAAIECTWMGKIFLRIEGKKKKRRLPHFVLFFSWSGMIIGSKSSWIRCIATAKETIASLLMQTGGATHFPHPVQSHYNVGFNQLELCVGITSVASVRLLQWIHRGRFFFPWLRPGRLGCIEKIELTRAGWRGKTW